MMKLMKLNTIAYMQSDFASKFGIPRQSGLVKNLQSTIVFTEKYRDPAALRGLETYSHIWLLWGFSETKTKGWSPTVRPPRLGGNARKGVFATRSPYRPNPIGLSSVKIDGIEQHPVQGPVIHVLGADLMNGTPIYDIKPYIPYADSHPDALEGFLGAALERRLQVDFDEQWEEILRPEQREILRDLLSHDPRPAYQDDPERVYGLSFGELEVKFTVRENALRVRSIERL